MRRICIAIVAVEQKYILHILIAVEQKYILHILSMSVALVIQHALRPVWLYDIFALYCINGMIFGKKVVEHKMCVLIFSAALPKIFLILRRIGVRYSRKCA
jgi:hypothetical protein